MSLMPLLRALIACFLIMLMGLSIAHAELSSAELFVDADPGEGSGQAVSVSEDGSFNETFERIRHSMSLSGINPGQHTLYLRFKDDAGNWSMPIGSSMYIPVKGVGGASAGSNFGIVAAEAFFDQDPGEGSGVAIHTAPGGIAQSSIEDVKGSLGLTGLAPGIYTVYVRFKDATGRWSPPMAQRFHLLPGRQVHSGNGDGASPIVAAEYQIDSGSGQSASAGDGNFGGLIETVNQVVSVSAGTNHSRMVTFIDAAGRRSSSTVVSDLNPRDQDWDGLPDSWEQANGLDPAVMDAYKDNDLDGFTNRQEYEAGTDPNDPSDYPANSVGESHLWIAINGIAIEEASDPSAKLRFTAQLSNQLLPGYAVFLNFDDQQGGWFKQTDDGGHIELINGGGISYWREASLAKPGLRSVRAGVFDTKGDADPSNDELVGRYSAAALCTEAYCLAAGLSDADYPRKKGYGDPAISGSGSQLFKQVDVAHGNYHFSEVDMAVPGKGPSFAFTRAYNSRSEVSKQWTFGYEMKAAFLTGTYDREIAIGPMEDGRMQHYFKDMDQLWYALNPGNFDQLIENPDKSFTLYTQGNRLYQFADPNDADTDVAGRLQSIKDRLGNALAFSYTSGYLTGATDANSRSYTITRDSGNRVQRVIDFESRYVEYSYDSNDMITQVRNMRGGYDRYTYVGTTGDDRYRLATITDPRNNLQVTIGYDASGRVDELTDGASQLSEFSYGTEGGKQATGIAQPTVDGMNHNLGFILDDDRTRVEERLDAKSYGDYRTKQAYKIVTQRSRIAELGLVNRIVEPNNYTADKGTDITFSADGRGNPLQVSDAAERISEATYGAVGGQQNLTPVTSMKRPGIASTTRYQSFTTTGKAQTIIDPNNNTSARQFDANDWVTHATNPRQFTTQYAYDAFGNATTITDALTRQTTRVYDDLGRLQSETSPLSLTTSYTYDHHSNLLTRTETAAGGINYLTQYVYDASDNLTRIIDPKGHQTDYTYDTLNRKLTESYTVGGVLHTRSYSYDAIGRLATVTNERNQTSETHYTLRSKVKYKVNPLQKTTVSYTYDKSGNLTSTTDAESRTVTTSYDILNRKTRQEDDLGNYQTWVYDSAGRVQTHRDQRGKLTHYEYDAVGNITKLTDARGGETVATYDGNGNARTVADPNSHTTTYTYDALDRRLSTTLHNGQQWLYTYDANGNQLTATTPTGELKVREYDALNRVTQLTEKAVGGAVTRQISYTYDANSNVETETSGGNTISYTYDELNRTSSVTDQYGQVIGYGYDKAGNRNSLTYPGNKTISYIYDNADQLKELTDWLNDTTTYTRNDAGQVTHVVNGNGTKVNYNYDNAGRLIQLDNKKSNDSLISRHIMTLDKGGNITQATANLPLEPTLPPSTGAMAYDNNNRILTAGNNSYTHDSTGRIIEEDPAGTETFYNFDINDHITSITRNSTTLSSYGYDLNNNRISQVQNGTETRYVIDPLAALPNVVAETDDQGNLSNYYIYGEGLVSQISVANDSHYYHYDPTGHTLALSNASGNVSDSYAYTPYGFTTAQGTTHNPFRYVGRHGVMDDGNGLHYMRARYYKEDIKRFMSLDALHGGIENPQALNRYLYSSGNPVMRIDPSGYKDGAYEVCNTYFSGGCKNLAKWLLSTSDKLNDMKNGVNNFTVENASKDMGLTVAEEQYALGAELKEVIRTNGDVESKLYEERAKRDEKNDKMVEVGERGIEYAAKLCPYTNPTCKYTAKATQLRSDEVSREEANKILVGELKADVVDGLSKIIIDKKLKDHFRTK